MSHLDQEQLDDPRVVVADSSPPPAAEDTVLSLSAIGKSFPGVRALHDVGFEVRAGEVHALVGENGAGKSTLMAIASGALAPDEGRIRIGDAELANASPQRARELGLGIVRQDPALLPDLTVAENMAVGVGYERVGGLRRAVRWSQAQLEPWGMGIDARSRVADLSMEQRFIVEIAKALALEPRVLVLDEPTEHLNVEEVQRLFRRVRELVAGGAGVVYISHRIPEVKQIADRITVLRDGRVRGTFDADAVDEQQIVELVVGRTLDAVFPDKPSGASRAPEQLIVSGLSSDEFSDVSLSVRAGEIVGLAGVQGNGQAALIRAVAGIVPATGTVSVAGSRVPAGSAAAGRAGIVYVPADRHGQGVFLSLPVGENIVSRVLDRVSMAGLVSERRSDVLAGEQVGRLEIKTPSPRTPISSLSGGNQQKAVMARTLLAQPRVLLAEEPTQGVDAGARVDIYAVLRGAADDGAAVLVLSSDGVELEGLCDRVLIMSRGVIVQELQGDDVTEEAIARAALTSTTLRARGERRSRGASWRRWLTGDHSPAAVLALIFLALGLGVGLHSPTYLSEFNLNSLLFMTAPLLFVGLAQQVVVLGAGFDLSVGPLMGFLVVIASFWIVDGGNLYAGVLLMVLAALGVGLVNGVLVTWLNVNPVVATLATYMALQGLYLSLRATPGGVIFPTVATRLQSTVGFVPVVTIAAVAVALVLEGALRWSRWGVALRASGSRVEAAERLGIKVNRVKAGSYVLCSLLVLPAGFIMMSQIGIGDGRPSLSYTLSSVTVVVLAGASIFGGRGSFVGIVAAAFLVQQVVNVSPFLGLSQAWSYWLPGLITIGAAVLYARLRQSRSLLRSAA